MTVRERTEKNERLLLCEYASFSDNATRQKPMKKCELRTEFQRDRDRIIHSKAFRRMKHKTQVFIAPEGDHFRTRLTHTLEVAQIGRTICRALRLNEDLIEAMSLSHDLGHTPFGHVGENVLNSLCKDGFDHADQSLRVIDVLEDLNLTNEVRDGIVMHNGKKRAKTLEGRVLKLADRIAYINHDIDDAIRAGVISSDDLPKELTEILGKTHGKRINSMIWAVIENSEGKSDISMKSDVLDATEKLRSFMFERVYFNEAARSEEVKVERVLHTLFDYYMKNPDLLPTNMKALLDFQSEERTVCDFLASMTDQFAIFTFEQIFVPKVWCGH